MAEKKTRILLRSDINSAWQLANPVLLKGEVGIEYNPTVTGNERVIKLKIGDGTTAWNHLGYVADYDAIIDAIEAKLDVDEASIAELKTNLAAEIARATGVEASKVDKELSGTNGESYIFNEADGGGSKFVDNTGAAVYVGTHDSIGGVAGVQIYADKDATGSESTIIDVTKNGAYYTKGTILPGEQRDVEANEIATKGDVANVLPSIDASKYNKYLHTDATGNLEWVHVEQGSANWGHISGNIEEQVDLMTKFNAIDTELANRYTKAETDTKIAEEIGKIKHWTYKVVQTLPTPSADCEHIIYLVPKDSGKTGYKEYVCINKGTTEVPDWKFEEIGDTDIDLSNYYTKNETYSKEEVNTKVTTLEAADTALGNRIKDFEDNKTNYDNAATKAHEHINKAELDLIKTGDVAKWNAKQDALTAEGGVVISNNVVKLADDLILNGGSASDFNA